MSTQVITKSCHGRISFSKHADYINSDLLYCLDPRKVEVSAEKIDEPKLILENQDENFENIELDLASLEKVEKKSWTFYPVSLYRKLANSKQGLKLSYSSDLPAASGLSSSHALMLATIYALVEVFELKDYQEAIENRFENPSAKILELLKLCQEVEQERGFNSGLGDQAAELFGKEGYFCFIKLFPKLKINYQKIPEDLDILTVASGIKADKSLPEFKAANENIKRYQEINELAKNFDCQYLADLLDKLSDAEIFQFLESIEDKQLRGLALYGLAEAARVKELKNNLNPEALGEHLNLSHQAERIYDHYGNALSEAELLNYKFSPSDKLTQHSGIYLASTKENDRLQSLALKQAGVYGSSISGAGLGGNNLILCDKNLTKDLLNALNS